MFKSILNRQQWLFIDASVCLQRRRGKQRDKKAKKRQQIQIKNVFIIYLLEQTIVMKSEKARKRNYKIITREQSNVDTTMKIKKMEKEKDELKKK